MPQVCAKFACAPVPAPVRSAAQVDADACYDQAEDTDWKKSKKYSRQKQGRRGMDAKVSM